MTLALPQRARRRRHRPPKAGGVIYLAVLAALLALAFHSPWWMVAVLWWLPVGLAVSATIVVSVRTRIWGQVGAWSLVIFVLMLIVELTFAWPALALAWLRLGRKKP